MSSENITSLKAHFLTDKQFNEKVNPSPNELWFAKLPHWLNYCGGTCLGITTQPTASGNEINFYRGASFIVHMGKYADGTLKNQIVYIDDDKYINVYSDGAYCFDENGEIIAGNISYNANTNLVSVDGVEGYYTQAVQNFKFDGEVVTLLGNIYPLSTAPTFMRYNDGDYLIDYGNGLIEQGGQKTISSSTTYITYKVEMRDLLYDIKITAQGTSYQYGNGGCVYNSNQPTTTGFVYYAYTNYIKKLFWSVKGLKA